MVPGRAPAGMKKESGANPERYRHCMCSGPTRGESQSLGTFPRRLCAGCQSTSQETCSRRFPLLSAYIGQAGFFVKTAEEFCDRFAVIDQELVWYGSMNLLAKEQIEDSMLRVHGKEIAAELLETALGRRG